MAEKELAALAEGGRRPTGHACELETSMVLALRGLYVAEDKRQRTDHGAVGFPEKATAENGRAFLNAAVHRTAEVVQGLLRKPLPP